MSKKSAIVSGFGFAMQIGAMMDELRRELGVSEEEFHVLATAKGRPYLAKMIKELSANQGGIRETNILKPEDPIVFPARNKPIDPNEFFNRSNAYPWGSFRERILPVLKPVVSSPKRTYVVGRLKKDAYDHDIRSGLPKCHLGNWEDIVSLIAKYPNGEESHYLLYMEGIGGEVFAVSVFWNYDDRQWFLSGWELGERGYWAAGSRVLCPGNATL